MKEYTLNENDMSILPVQKEILDIRQCFKSQRRLFLSQEFDTRLTELAARAHSLQKTGESSITEEMLPADVSLTVDGVAKDVDRCFTSALVK